MEFLLELLVFPNCRIHSLFCGNSYLPFVFKGLIQMVPFFDRLVKILLHTPQCLEHLLQAFIASPVQVSLGLKRCLHLFQFFGQGSPAEVIDVWSAAQNDAIVCSPRSSAAHAPS